MIKSDYRTYIENKRVFLIGSKISWTVRENANVSVTDLVSGTAIFEKLRTIKLKESTFAKFAEEKLEGGE